MFQKWKGPILRKLSHETRCSLSSSLLCYKKMFWQHDIMILCKQISTNECSPKVGLLIIKLPRHIPKLCRLWRASKKIVFGNEAIEFVSETTVVQQNLARFGSFGMTRRLLYLGKWPSSVVLEMADNLMKFGNDTLSLFRQLCIKPDDGSLIMNRSTYLIQHSSNLTVKSSLQGRIFAMTSESKRNDANFIHRK